MAATIKQIIATAVPGQYNSGDAKKLKALIKDKGFQVAAKTANPKSETHHKLIYDSPTESLEPMYFWILDFLGTLGFKAEKFVDNFSSSAGSGHFGEMGQRASIMQQQGSKLMGDLNTVLRSTLNLLYDLRDFRTRLQSYDDVKSKDKARSNAAILSLKQLWMDKVDAMKGNSSLKAMALGQANFVTLLDAFLVVKNEKHAEQIDLNDRVKRILIQRVREFNIWIKQSEKELQKRYNIEKHYLKSQVQSLKLYARWAKPYLKAARELEATDRGRDAALVKMFSTTVLELTLFGQASAMGSCDERPGMKSNEKYFPCILVDFYFRAIPQKVTGRGDYVFGGRAEVTFSSYSLTEDEIKTIKKELDNSDLEDAFELGSTDYVIDSFKEIEEEINFFLEDKESEADKKKKEEVKDQSNPFLAIIGHYDKPSSGGKKKKKKKSLTSYQKWVDAPFRGAAAFSAMDRTYTAYSVYKKAHGMPAFDKY